MTGEILLFVFGESLWWGGIATLVGYLRRKDKYNRDMKIARQIQSNSEVTPAPKDPWSAGIAGFISGTR